MKTIKQLAEENKTYKQKIFRIIKNRNIVTSHVSGIVMVDVTAEKAIIKALNENSKKHCTETVSSQSDTSVTVYGELLAQLKEKDEQINQLHALLNQQQQLNLKTLQENQSLKLELNEKENTIQKKWWKFWI